MLDQTSALEVPTTYDEFTKDDATPSRPRASRRWPRPAPSTRPASSCTGSRWPTADRAVGGQLPALQERRSTTTARPAEGQREKLAECIVTKGYIANDSASAEPPRTWAPAFIAGNAPMIVARGSWWYGRFKAETEGELGPVQLFPGNKLNAGSSGNLWVVPGQQQLAKSLADDFIDITLRPGGRRTLMATTAACPVAA